MKKNKELIILGIFLVLFFIFLLILNWLNPTLLWDENAYLGNARNHISHSNFTEEFRFPFLEYAISGVWLLTGESILAARIMIMLFSIASIIFIYLISKEYFNQKLSLLLTLLFAISPLILSWSFRIYTDIPAMFFVIVSFYMILISEKNQKNKNNNGKNNTIRDKSRKGDILIGLAGFLSAIAFLARFTTALFPLAVAIYFISKKDIKKIAIFSVIFILTLLPWLSYNYISYGNPLWDFQEQFQIVAKWTPPQPIIIQIGNLFINSNPLIPLLFICGIYVIIKRKINKNLNSLLLISTIFFLVYILFLVNMKYARYYIIFLPFIYLVSFQTINFIIEKQKKNNENKGYEKRKTQSKNKKLKYIYSLIILLLIFSALFQVFVLIKGEIDSLKCEKSDSIMQSINYLKEKSEEKNGKIETDVIFSNNWPWYGYHLDVKVFSLWDKDIDMLVQTYNATYVIYKKESGMEYDKKILDDSVMLELEKIFEGECDTTYLYKVNS